MAPGLRALKADDREDDVQLEGLEFTAMIHEEFVYALEVARGLHDPAEDWEAFIDALWHFHPRVFGLELDDATSRRMGAERAQVGARECEGGLV